VSSTRLRPNLPTEIIKVEEIAGGDQTRNIPPHEHGECHYFLTITDDRFATAVGRKQNREQLERLVGEIMATRSTADWQAIFGANDVPFAPVNTVAEALAMPIVAERQIIQEIEHPTVERMPRIRTPVRFVGRFEETAPQPAPLLGEHTAGILSGLLHYDAARIEALTSDGAVATTARNVENDNG